MKYKLLKPYTTNSQIILPIQNDIFIYFITISQSSGGGTPRRFDRTITLPGLNLLRGKMFSTETAYGTDTTFISNFRIRTDSNNLIVETIDGFQIGCEIYGYQFNYQI